MPERKKGGVIGLGSIVEHLLSIHWDPRFSPQHHKKKKGTSDYNFKEWMEFYKKENKRDGIQGNSEDTRCETHNAIRLGPLCITI